MRISSCVQVKEWIVGAMATYSKKAQDKIEAVIHEYKGGTLHSGKKVTDRKQAVAIGIEEAWDAGTKVPKKR